MRSHIKTTRPRWLLALAVVTVFGAGLLWSAPEGRLILALGLVVFGGMAFIFPGTTLAFLATSVSLSIAGGWSWWIALVVALAVAIVWGRIAGADRTLMVALFVIIVNAIAELPIPTWMLLLSIFVVVFLGMTKAQLIRNLQETEYVVPARTPPDEKAASALTRLEGSGYRHIGSFETTEAKPKRWDILSIADEPWTVSLSGPFLLLISRFHGGHELVTSSRAGVMGTDKALIQHLGSTDVDRLTAAHRTALHFVESISRPLQPEADGHVSRAISSDRSDREWMRIHPWRTTFRWLSSPMVERAIDNERPPPRLRRWLRAVSQVSPGEPGSR